MIRKLLYFTILILALANNSHASTYKESCKKLGLGWNFYCDNKKNKKKEPKDSKKEEATSPTIAQIATNKTKEIKKRHQELLDIATHFPTQENIRNYIEFNQMMLDKSSYFAEVSKRAIWQTPEINYALKRPINSAGKRVWIEEKNKKEVQAVRSLKDKFGIFFFYRSDCPYCHAFSPTLKKLAKEFDIDIMAISMDGVKLSEWPNSKIDSGQAQKLGITTVPATIAFDKKTSQIIPIGFGALSRQELIEQIYHLTQTKPGEIL